MSIRILETIYAIDKNQQKEILEHVESTIEQATPENPTAPPEVKEYWRLKGGGVGRGVDYNEKERYFVKVNGDILYPVPGVRVD